MFGEKAVCPDGLFVPAVFQESDFYLNSLTWSWEKMKNDLTRGAGEVDIGA